MANVKFFRTNATPRTLESRQEAKGLGAVGEQLATCWLVDHGYAILEKNYRRGNHELDIIAMDGGELVVVEVKTRSDTLFGAPEDAVDHRKRQILVRMANQYIRSHRWQGTTRFDILSIVTRDGQPDIHHIKDAFNVMNY